MKRSLLALLASTLLAASAGCAQATQTSEDGTNRTATTAAGEKQSTPVRRDFTQVDDARIAYEVHGDLKSGETPLLALHGSLMSAESMAPFIAPFVASRPVIAVDARGHGRTGDVPGGITYERMADDAAAVLRVLGVKRVDVFGYSMGATTALMMAVRHPDLVDKQIVMSGVSARGGWFPASQEGFEKWNAEMFAGSPVEAAWKDQSATPNAFASVIDKLREAETANYDLSLEELRGIAGKTMIITGDHDGVQLSHVLQLFAIRGGINEEIAVKGFLNVSPRARLAILPATAHIGMYERGELLAQLIIPFLNDEVPAPASGFFEGMDKPSGEQK